MRSAVDGLDALVGAAVDGDRRSIERLLAEVCPWLVRYCRARVGRVDGSFAAADDLAREVCLAVLAALPRYRFQARSFLGLVYDIAAAKAAKASDAGRHHPYRPAAQPAVSGQDSAGVGQQTGAGAFSDEMTRLLRVLPAIQRESLLLRVIAGLSVEQTANALGCTSAAVRVAEHRAMTQGRKILSSDRGDS